MTATITLTPNTIDAYPATVEFISLGGESTPAIFFESTEGEQIPTTTTSFVCCFAPSASSTLSLVTTYDVYDSKGKLSAYIKAERHQDIINVTVKGTDKPFTVNAPSQDVEIKIITI